jgi:hypothetical protein
MALDMQEDGNWCWAASGKMIMENYSQSVDQCREVDDRHSNELQGADCCAPQLALLRGQDGDPCNLTGWPEFCLHKINNSILKGKGLTWDELKTELGCRKSPVAFSWMWDTAGHGHMMVAVGYSSDSNMVFVNDPELSGGQRISYESYAAATFVTFPDGYQEHKHWDDFYHFQPDPGTTCTDANHE